MIGLTHDTKQDMNLNLLEDLRRAMPLRNRVVDSVDSVVDVADVTTEM